MSRENILVVEDDAGVREMVRFVLEDAGYAVGEAQDVAQASAKIAARPPALILLDWMLPGASGVELARRLKKAPTTRDIPIILLTAKGEENDKVVGLESGADDYITKPFSPRELVARIQAVLRRTQPVSQPVDERALDYGDIRIEPQTRRVLVNGDERALTAKEFDLLWALASNPRRVLNRDQLLDQVWGFTEYVDPSTVTVHVRRLREKVEADPSAPRYIQTVWGVGYKFEP